ncbi:MAG: hypothetical protein EHM13_06180 [Acidobacteria bacterium]|nr:MAG: hypothetical protein EHM13_06180 [Acidobacteriota bacterium]
MVAISACGGQETRQPAREGAEGTTGATVRNPAELVRTEGTERLFAPPADLRSGEVVCEGANERYVADMTGPVSRSDDEMEVAGRCSSLDLPFYVPTAGGGRDGRVYLKTGQHMYLRLRED